MMYRLLPPLLAMLLVSGCAGRDQGNEWFPLREGASQTMDVRYAMDEPREEGVRCLGFLSEEDKAAAMAGASVVVCPSPFESLSIVLLEGLALGAPALVNGVSPVLKEHCLRSNAGLYYENGDEYAEAMDLLARDGRLRAALAANGRRYVDAEYRWGVVLERWTGLLAAVRGGG